MESKNIISISSFLTKKLDMQVMNGVIPHSQRRKLEYTMRLYETLDR